MSGHSGMVRFKSHIGPSECEEVAKRYLPGNKKKS